MTEHELHQQMIRTAAELSEPLRAAIEANGPVLRSAPRQRPLVDVLSRVVAGQQLSVKAARSIWGRVVAGAGAQPLRDYLDSASTEELRGHGLSGAKVRCVKAIASAAAAGNLDADELRDLDHGQRRVRLTRIWGIGDWTADMMSISYFGDPDIWPDGDVTARKTLTRLTSKRRKTVRTAERFAPYRTYLAIHMWQAADAEPAL